MLFFVKKANKAFMMPTNYPFVLLEWNNWDDYSYQTTFNVELHLSPDTVKQLGAVKILEKDQMSGATPLPESPFNSLGKNYCSLGGSVGYYEDLYKCGADIYETFLSAISDVVFDDEIKADFEDLDGYRVSLLRFSKASSTISVAKKLFENEGNYPARRRVGFHLNFRTAKTRFSKSYKVKFDFVRKGKLPNRVNALIGYNGSGKTRLLSDIATVVSGYGYADKDELLNSKSGRLIGNKPNIKTVIVVSYSAFDTFAIPGVDEAERAVLSDSGGIHGYVYCGLRERLDRMDLDESKYRLKTQEEIQQEFLKAVERVRDLNREEDLVNILKPLYADASFETTNLSKIYTLKRSKKLAQWFSELSSGHKIVLKMIVDILAHIDANERTLILLDEPETHLHPPLIACLLRSLRRCLEMFDGYAVLATHSPVVLQEIPSRYVHVLRRFENGLKIKKTRIETFGEDVGAITQDVFNLDDGEAEWHETLREMAATRTLSQIEELFETRLGFGPKSFVDSVHDEGVK